MNNNQIEQGEILVNTQYERKRFEEHINAENNIRILFSGKYGCGKTYFLQEFFNSNKPNYEVFHLFPTNYAVSSNDDIVKFLQIDILYEIIVKGLLSQPEQIFSKIETIGYFVQYNFSKIIRDVISHCNPIGKKLANIIDWFSKFKDFEKKMNETNDVKAKDFYVKLANETEYDAITETIEIVISSLEKKKVLIIDDLDRIDPEHIFRLLNVFSAQLSNYFPAHKSTHQDENRYGFDKVIFVCDIDNIRNIYHAKYGDKTDFLGYIDKFYSISPFHFNNNSQIASKASLFVKSIKSECPIDDRGILTSLTRMLLYHNIISLRQLVDKENSIWEYPTRKYPKLNGEYNSSSILLIDYVIFLFGSIEDAIKTLHKHEEEVSIEILKNSQYRLTDFLIPFLQDDKPIAHITPTYYYKNPELNISIKYSCKADHNGTYTIIDMDDTTDYNGNKKTSIPYFGLLKIAVENYWLKTKTLNVLQY